MEIQLGGPDDALTRVLYDFRHLDGTDFQSVSSSASRERSGGSFGPTGATGYFNIGTTAGAGTVDTAPLDEFGIRERITSGAGAPGSRVLSSFYWNVPIQDFGLYPAAFRQRRRFTLQGLLQMVTASTSAPYFLGLQGGNVLLDGANGFGAQIFCPAGGTWAARHRLSPANPIGITGDSGIPGTTPIVATLRYTEGATPILEGFVNESRILLLEGLSNMPGPNAFPSPALGLQSMYGGGANNVVGNIGICAFSHLRYLVELLVP